jgi:hypothetical protein
MYQQESSYTTPATIEQESKTSFNHLADHLRTTRAAIAQTKLTLARLRRCYSSARMRGVVDQLCTGMDAALSTLERLDVGPSSGGTL